MTNLSIQQWLEQLIPIAKLIQLTDAATFPFILVARLIVVIAFHLSAGNHHDNAMRPSFRAAKRLNAFRTSHPSSLMPNKCLENVSSFCSGRCLIGSPKGKELPFTAILDTSVPLFCQSPFAIHHVRLAENAFLPESDIGLL
jgi:hypothetical protein